MNLPLHPAIVHIPLGLAFILPILALTLLIAVWRGSLPARAWLLAALLQGAVVAAAHASMRTGESDEERAEARVSEALIEVHEERAEAFTWSAGLTLALLLAAGLSGRNALGGLATAATFASAGLAVAVGHAGGQLVHGPGGLADPGALAASAEGGEGGFVAGAEGGEGGLFAGGEGGLFGGGEAEEEEEEDDD